MQKTNRAKITLSSKQWNKIDNAVIKSGKKNIHSYIVSQLHELENLCRDGEDIEIEFAKRQLKIFWLTPSSMDKIEKISCKTGIKDFSTIISKFIINPLLLK